MIFAPFYDIRNDIHAPQILYINGNTPNLKTKEEINNFIQSFLFTSITKTVYSKIKTTITQLHPEETQSKNHMVKTFKIY